MPDISKAVRNIEEQNAWEKTDEVVELHVKRPLNIVVPVRLSADNWMRIKEEAGELGVGPTTLVRMWVLERLRLSHLHSGESDTILAKEQKPEYKINPACSRKPRIVRK